MKIHNKQGGISIVRDTVINQAPPIVITNEQKVEESTKKVEESTKKVEESIKEAEEPTNVHDVEEENIDVGVSLPKKSKKAKQNEG